MSNRRFVVQAMAIVAAVAGADVACAADSLNRAEARRRTSEYCAQLENYRYRAASEGRIAQLAQGARTYIDSCRASRSKPEIAIAMEELAFVSRQEGRSLDALQRAQACINFEYLSVGCHAEKAYALMQQRMTVEAREVLKTGYEVAVRAERLAGHALESAENKKSLVQEDEYNRLVRLARWRLEVASFGRSALREVEVAMQQGAK